MPPETKDRQRSVKRRAQFSCAVFFDGCIVCLPYCRFCFHLDVLLCIIALLMLLLCLVLIV